ncbi:hypothetical protein [Coprobacter fastidiosus]|uniref:GDSL-like lipase/acylhydrolase family protein n=1 Tax=Coprobacter fastidiosus NSB1 = JCM 33896 TaxID=1349822 RepID=A0A495VLA7_9BACT|nr:hypothetical protein [Coprobacter fastidiosus]ERM88972.1 hypothetical protein NSB1T_12060 [Coprobacter fastidiosus NSB1 = JCM 33896]RKT49223.1 hypothetical protein BC742_2765 [Coprobacter fastidiosus NSB1 = JCM 33896]BEG61638.1 hypothetical protein Cfast33896_05930 [Coprobacter fastidiosus]
MAGYEDTKQKIISTLMGRPNGTEIQPENHQDYALNMLDYIRSLELIATSTLIGVAEEITTPVQPNNSRVCYIAGVAQNQTAVFLNFIGQDGQPISVTTKDEEGVFVILMWNTQYWSAQTFSTNIISQVEQATLYYGYNIRKTYASIADMNSDIDNPIGTDGKYLKIGDVVTVSNTTMPSENGFYSYEGNVKGWKFQSSFNFQLTQNIGSNPNSAMSQNAATVAFALQRLYKTSILNWDISKTCYYAKDISDFIIDIKLTGDILGAENDPHYWAPISVHTDIKMVILYETDADGNYLEDFNSISVSLKGDNLSYVLNQAVKDKNGLTGNLSIVVDWTLWKHGKQEAMKPLRLNDDVLKDHFGFISILENVEITTDNVKAGYIKNVDNANINSWNNGVITEYHGKNGFTFKNMQQNGSGGIRTTTFIPNPNYHCIIDIEIQSISSGVVTVYLFGANGDKQLQAQQLQVGKNSFEFDPAYHSVYNNQTNFYLIVAVSTYESTVNVKNFICAQYPIGQTENLTETISDLQKEIAVLEGKVTSLESSSDIILTSPNGTKYVVLVGNNGVVTTTPLYPEKALFIGNSLLLGNGDFGMDATDKTKDYYDIIKEHILAFGTGNYTSKQLSGTGFEDAESITTSNAWIEDILELELDADADLVVVQLGDNVNTELKRTTFKSSCETLVHNIRQIAPKARVAWVYGWYVNSEVRTTIQNALKSYGGIYIEINDLNTKANQSEIGTVITHDSVKSQNLVYDTLEIISATQLKITFTVEGKQYISEITVNSYQDSSSSKTVSWQGYETITVSAGVASHPGNLGFEKIAQRIIEGLKM